MEILGSKVMHFVPLFNLLNKVLAIYVYFTKCQLNLYLINLTQIVSLIELTFKLEIVKYKVYSCFCQLVLSSFHAVFLYFKLFPFLSTN